MKKIAISFITLLMLNLITFSTVYAVTTLDANLNTITNELKKGQEVEVTFKLDNLNDVKKGINAYKATLQYDDEIFEQVVQKDFSCQNNWEGLEYNTVSREFVAFRKVGIKQAQDVVKIKLKVKENVEATKTEIKLHNVIVSEGKGDILLPDAKVILDITKDQVTEPTTPDDSNDNNNPSNPSNPSEGSNGNNNGANNNNPSNPSNPSEGSNGNNNGGSTNNTEIETPSNPNIDNSTGNNNQTNNSQNNQGNNGNATTEDSTNKLPENQEQPEEIKNHVKIYLDIFVFLLLVLLVVVTIILIKRNKSDDSHSNEKRKYMIFIIAGIICVEFIGTSVALAITFAQRGELNGDGQINYADASLLELHLVNLKALSNEYVENADMNSDGKITVTDLSLLIQKLENKLEYEVNLLNLEVDNYYPEKEESLTITFVGDVSYGAEIRKLVINGQEYEVQKKENSYEYSLSLNVGNIAGFRTYKITEAHLENDKIIKINNTINLDIDVLKEIPTIKNYRVEEDIDNSKLIIKFEMIDPDDSLTEGSFIIYNDVNDEDFEFRIKKGENSIEVEVEEGKEYNATLDLKYNLDSDKLENDVEHEGGLSLEKTLQLIIDYNFNITNIKTDKGSTYTNGEQVKLFFESTNATKHTPISANVNGKSYDVEALENGYAVTLDSLTQIGEHTITLESVTLSNGKEFELIEDNTVVIDVIKRKPSISNLTTSENIANEDLKVMFDLDDKDYAVSTINVELFDDKGNKIVNAIVDREDVKETIVNAFLETSGVITSHYQIKISLNYNLTGKDTDNVENELVSDTTVVASPKVTIKNVVPNTYYVEKGGVVKLIYTLETNRDDDIVKILVNNVNCIAKKLENGDYEVSLNVGKTSGLYSLTTTRFTYADDSSASLEHTVKVDVLKNRPSIKNFKQEDNLADNKVILSFDVEDAENAFVEGQAILTLNGVIQEKAVTKGHNNLEFNVEFGEKYLLEIKATYDLDSNKLENMPHEDNKVTNSLIDSREIVLIADYELNIENIKTYNQSGYSKYFAKNEAIIVSFESSNASNYEPIKAIVNGREYALTKNENVYNFTLNGHDTAGVKTYTIDKLILSNSKELQVTENNEIKLTVLKDKPTATQFGYSENVDGTISAVFNLVDLENAIVSGKFVVLNNGTVVKEQEITKDLNTLTFQPSEGQSYVAKVIVNYDLDMNELDENANYYENMVLLEADITLGARKLEMKDIINTIVYKETANGIEEVITLREADLANLNNYIVKVQMKDMPVLYTKIKEYRIDDNKLKLTLDYDGVVRYEGDIKQDKFEITYGTISNGVATNISLENLIKAIEANPNGSFTLTRDYDASTISINTSTLITSTFVGTLNGNGYTIYNLDRPLFNTVEGATIENLTIEGAKLTGSTSRGTIANVANTSTIRNVHVKDLSMITGANHSAGIVGEATSLTVEACSVKNFDIATKGHVRVAAIVGKMTNGSIRNCYVEGSLTSTNTNDGNGIGGILGHGFGIETIENCISKVSITHNGGHRLNGGIVGLFANKSSSLKNSVSLSTGSKFYSVHGNERNGVLQNNYELSDSGLTTNVYGDRVKSVTKEEITDAFFKDVVKFDEAVWDLTNASFEHLPTLKASKQNNALTKEEQPANDNVYIPDYGRIKKLNGFSVDKEILYHNIYKLMPYYDAKYLVEDGLRITNDNILNTKLIKHILAFNTDKMVTYLSDADSGSLKKIKVVFEDNTVEEYTITFKELNNNIAIYTIDSLNINYAYDNYLVKGTSTIVDVVAEYIKALDYTNDLDPLTTAADSRLYRDHYNEVMKSEARNIALQILQNDFNSPLVLDSDILNKKIKAELIDSGKLKSILYAYNYLYRWYDLNIGNAIVSDIMMFEGKMFNSSMTLENLVNDVLTGNLATNSTHTFYGQKISKYATGKSDIGSFLDSIIANVGGYKDVNDWFTNNYKGIVYEIEAVDHPDVEYRAWRQLKRRNNFLLPFVTLPDYAAYIVSSPTQFLVGAQRTYITDPSDETQRQNLYNMINNCAVYIRNFYSTTAGFIEAERLNNYTDIQVDNRYAGGYQSAGTTEEPFHKNFNEAVGYWAAANGSAAYATGSNVYWVSSRALTAFGTWSHETGHNQDSKIFLKGGGRRGAAEEYADGNTSQGAGDGGVNFNLSSDQTMDAFTTTNLTPERINSTAKIEEFYKRSFELWDFLDYAYAKAFLQLTPEEQSKVAYQIDYPNNNANNTRWTQKTADDFAAMNLKTVEDLWDNQIVIDPKAYNGYIRPGGGKYGYGSVYPTRWYQTHNDLGRSDCYSFKYLAWEMLGIGGYDGGYATYYSKRSANDLDAIRKVTGDPTMTWKKYKLGRYELMDSYWDKIAYIDADELYNEYLEALKLDAKNNDYRATASMNVKRRMYHFIKRVTNDFREEVFTENEKVIHIKTAEEFQQKILEQRYGNFVLDNDLDLSNLAGTNAIIDGSFWGKLDGNGHTITGLTMPLFQKIRFGYVTNLKFDNITIDTRTANQAAALASVGEYATVTNIVSTNTEIILNGTVKHGAAAMVASYSISRVEADVKVKMISIKSVEDFVKINDLPGKIYSIDSDIDFAGYTGRTAVITKTFTGRIEGNGHTLSNLNNLSLFSSFNGTIENVNIKNFSNVGTGNFITAFANKTLGATLRNMKFDGITLVGANNVAVVSGQDGESGGNKNSVIENISVKNANVKGTGVYVSTFIGRKFRGSIKNVFVQGEMEVTTTENGGVVGASQKGGTIENVISKVNIRKSENTYTSNLENSEFNGGVVGNIYDSPTIKNSIALGTMEGFTDSEGNKKMPYKFVGAVSSTVASTIQNCYEYAKAQGFSRIDDETKANLKLATEAQIRTKSFYKDTLSFDEAIWNLDAIEANGYPELR